MSGARLLHDDPDRPALIDDATGAVWTHAQLRDEVRDLAAQLRERSRSLVFCRSATNPATVVNYLAALAAGHAVAMVDDALQPDRLADLERVYEPGVVLHPDRAPEIRRRAPSRPLHPDLALMLTTSGSTGNPKLVRLSAANLLANADSIRRYLEIDPSERAIASLPLHYSYGLSVLNSHLLAGATLVLPADGLGRPGFWDCFERHGCTSFAGVPYSYAILERTGWRRRALPTLRTMTQAGGRMEPEAKLSLAAELEARGARLVVMYGQTEATARIAYVPSGRLREKPTAIGIAIPGGTLSVEREDGSPMAPGEEGELVYRGPNVMLGYAQAPADLADGNALGGVLRTGDLGYADPDGFFHATRRRARFAKAAARQELAAAFALPSRTFDVRELPALPVTGSGKIDYAALTALRP
jgi:long-chain acyl-CoA synthetase